MTRKRRRGEPLRYSCGGWLTRIVLVLLCECFFLPSVRCADIAQQDLWVSGTGGYHTYRIPAMVVAKSGTVLAFCEGRHAGRGDAGDIDVLLKRSTDSGRTWSETSIVWSDEGNTCGNPCPVLDERTGTIWLLMTWNLGQDREAQIIQGTSKDTRRVFVTSSKDDGVSWAKPREITAQVKATNWTWYATGPGAALQIANGRFAGRLVIPCDHIQGGTKRSYSHVIYSDDHGATWNLGGSSPAGGANECQVVELTGGRLLLNMRNANSANRKRLTALSTDGGATWSKPQPHPELPEPICQASIRRFSWPAPDRKSVLLFSNPASETERSHLTVRQSYDEGQTWPTQVLLHAGPSAYSDLAVIDGEVGCLYENGTKDAYEKITLAIIRGL